MRKRDFLTEAGLKTRDFYERYRLENFIKQLEGGDPFFTTTGEQIVIPAHKREIALLKSILKNNFDSKDKNPKSRAISPVELDMPTTVGGVPLSKLEKTKEFGGTIGRSKTGEMDVSKANLGPTVEALKSFAIYARLVIRNKEVITAEDVIKIGKLAAAHSKTDFAVSASGKKSKNPTTFAIYNKNVADKNKAIKDTITLKIALSSPSFQRAVQVTPTDKAAWGNLQGILSYVNTESDIKKYSRYFANNNRKDPINISVVGIGGAKTDISSTYVDPKTGTEKSLKNLSMSVKSAGAEWYDQASGNNAEGIRKFYSIIGLNFADADAAMNAVKFTEGGRGDTDAQFEKRVKQVSNLYKITYEQLKAAIPSLNDLGEATYIKNFLGRLRYALAGDESLIYVKFDANGTYEKLNPNTLARLAEIIDLDVKLIPASATNRAKISWYDTKSNRELIYVVLLKNPPNRRLTHQFNLGSGFFDIFKEAKSLAAHPPTPGAVAGQQSVPQPLAKAPATKKAPQPQQPTRVQQPIAPQQLAPIELGPDELTA